MATERNLGRAIQIRDDYPEGKHDWTVWVRWLCTAVAFLLDRYIDGE